MRFVPLAAFLGIAVGLITGFLIWNVGEPPEPEQSEEKEAVIFSGDLLEIEALKNFFHKRFLYAWRNEREEDPEDYDFASAEVRFNDSLNKIPLEIGRSAAERRNNEDELDDAIAMGGSIALIDLTRKGAYLPDTKDLEWELIDRCTSQRESGLEVNGAVFSDGDWLPLTPGMTIAFEPGIFSLDETRLRAEGGYALPTDVAIQGAGMDATMVELGNINVKGNVERLTLRDLTIDAVNDGLFYLRTGSLIVNLERVRIVRFDAGHGRCDIFRAEGGMLIRANECEFIGGYGEHPGSADLFKGNPILARFTRCHFELLRLALHEMQRTHSRGRISFQDCTFTLLSRDPFTTKIQNVDFPGSLVEKLLPRGTQLNLLQKDFDEFSGKFGM